MDFYGIRNNIQYFETGEELLASSVSFDLVFMDIMLNEENGIEIGKKLYWKNKSVKIIFQQMKGLVGTGEYEHFHFRGSDNIRRDHTHLWEKMMGHRSRLQGLQILSAACERITTFYMFTVG